MSISEDPGLTELPDTVSFSSPHLRQSISSAVPHIRCEPDPLDPDSNICLAKVTSDDRQGISHFFGRNKKPTASIPEDMFPVLCRTHYQEKQYRWRDDPAAFAAFQCDCILKTLEQMCRRVWVDPKGIKWPYWCGFELQVQRPNVSRSRQASSSEESAAVPDWLRVLCTNSPTHHPSPNVPFNPIGERQPVRYSFSQLTQIVKSIKTYVLSHGTKLPRIEALPITIGMVDEANLEEAKRKLKTATRDLTIARMELTRHTQLGNSTGHRGRSSQTKGEQLQATLEQKQQAVQEAQTNLSHAEEDAAATRETVPSKRQIRYPKTINTSKKSKKSKTELIQPSTAQEDDRQQPSVSVSPRSRAPQIEPITDDEADNNNYDDNGGEEEEEIGRSENKENHENEQDSDSDESLKAPGSRPGKRRLILTLRHGRAAKRARHD